MVKKVDFNTHEHNLQTQLLQLKVHLQNLESDVARVKTSIAQVEGAQEMIKAIKGEQEQYDAVNDEQIKALKEQNEALRGAAQRLVDADKAYNAVTNFDAHAVDKHLRENGGEQNNEGDTITI